MCGPAAGGYIPKAGSPLTVGFVSGWTGKQKVPFTEMANGTVQHGTFICSKADRILTGEVYQKGTGESNFGGDRKAEPGEESSQQERETSMLPKIHGNRQFTPVAPYGQFVFARGLQSRKFTAQPVIADGKRYGFTVTDEPLYVHCGSI